MSTAEILTTEIRSTGKSAANAVARIGGVFSHFLIRRDTPFLTIGSFVIVIRFPAAATA